MTLQTLLDEASKLSREEQEELIDKLVARMGPDAVALTPAQSEDLERRMEEYRAGKAKLIDGEEAMRQLRARK